MNVSISEARNLWSSLLAEVARGTEVTITRRGVPVAKLVPAGPSFDQEKARRVADGLRAASRSTTLGGITIKELLDEGRS